MGHRLKLILVLLGSGALIGGLFGNCSGVQFAPSPVESLTLKSEVFEFDPHSLVDGVTEEDGIPTENLRSPSSVQALSQLVQDCTKPVKIGDLVMDRKVWERGEALKEAEADLTRKTVPVEYAISFGKAEDELAHWAHKRAILSESNPGYTYIPVGLKNSSVHKNAQGTSVHAYYLADHDKAKEQYRHGQRCFYSTVKLTSPLKTMPISAGSTSLKYDFLEAAIPGASKFQTRHQIHYMHYGYCNGCATEQSLYGPGRYSASGAPNRLFDEWPHKEMSSFGVEEFQFVKLYVADLREGQFRLSQYGEILKQPEGVLRGHEKEIDLKDTLNLSLIHERFGQAVRNLSAKYQGGEGFEFSGMVGVPQLLSNLKSAATIGVVLASQYTPVVLDLGSPKVRTSSLEWGSYFNMAAEKDTSKTGLDEYLSPHKTAWLGGDLSDVNGKASDGYSFNNDWRRVSDDGFLVLPDVDGKVRSSRNLFGDRTEIEGKTYPNGFVALQVYAKKNCANPEVKDRYIGPWDTAYSEIKVWIDADRNGVAEATEISSLEEQGVAALNVCYIEHMQSEDAFGNGTSMRSAFLKVNPGEQLPEAEILTRLEDGKKSDGTNADFRLAIDLVFKVNKDLKLY